MSTSESTWLTPRTASPAIDPDDAAMTVALAAVSSAFASLGRVFFCVDASFHVLHASSQLDRLVGDGASHRAEDRPLADLLGSELFGPAGTLRQLMLAGERREGWRSSLTVPGAAPRAVSVTAAPFCAEPGAVCDPRVAYVVVLRPAEEDQVQAGSPFPGLIGRSPGLERIFRLIENLEHSEATVLLTGESGTGKEVVARAIHARSPRRAGPVRGRQLRRPARGAARERALRPRARGLHRRGARPRGALRAGRGRHALPRRGRRPAPAPAGEAAARAAGAHLRARGREPAAAHATAASSPPPTWTCKRAVAEGRFREDLYYRLRVVPIEIPPLRERREDIEPLATFLLARVGARQGRALRFSPDALRLLLEHAWPGNVRELENTLEYAVAVCKGQTILPDDLPGEVVSQGSYVSARADATPAGPARGRAAAAAARRAEADAVDAARIRGALEACHWRRHEAARVLGMSRTTLWRRMRELGLE